MPRKRRRIKSSTRVTLFRAAAAAAIIIVGAAVIASACLDLLLTAAIPALLSTRLDARVKVGGSSYNLADFRIRVTGLEMEKNGILLRCPEIGFRPDPAGMLKGAVALADVRVERPTLKLPADISPLSLLIRMAGAGTGKIPFSLRNLRITGGAILPSGSRTAKWKRIEQLNLSLPLLANTAARAGGTSGGLLAPELTAVIGGTPASFTGTSRITGNGIEARMRIVIPGLDIAGSKAVAGFIPGAVIERGMADLDFDSVFTLEAGERSSLALSGGGSFRDIVLRAPGLGLEIPELRFRGRFSPAASLLRLDEVVLERPRVTAGAGIMTTLRSTAALPPVDSLTIKGGEFADPAHPGLRLYAIEAELSSFPAAENRPAPFTATAIAGGGAVRITGGIMADGTFTASLEGHMLDLKEATALSAQAVSVRAATARRLGLTLSGRLPAGPLKAAVSAAEIDGLELVSPAGSVFRSESVSIGGGSIADAAPLALGRLAADSFTLTLAQDEETGWLEESVLLQTDLDLAGGEIALAGKGPWLREVELRTEHAGRGNLILAASPVSGGRLTLSGPVPATAPLRGELYSRIDGVSVKAVSGLLAGLVPRLPEEGRIDAAGRIVLPGPVFRGRAGITGLAAGSREDASSIAVESLDLEQVVFDPSAPLLSVADGVARGAVVRIRKSEGKTSPRRPWRRKDTPIRSGRLRLADCAVIMEDNTVDPPLTLRCDIGEGEVSNIGRLTAINASGRVSVDVGGEQGSGELAGLRIAGLRVNGEDEFGITFSLKGMELAPLSPYLYRLAAFALKQGLGDWHGRISLRRGLITADTRMVLRGLAPVAGPDCRFDPDLALALLLSPEGAVELAMPFAATANQDFSLYGVIGKKLRTLLLRSSVVPFSLLAGPDGRFPDEFIRFAPGSAAIEADGVENLELLARAMKRRPAIGISVRGSGPLLETADGGRVDLARERTAAVVQFLHDRGIDYSRLRTAAGPDELGGELLDRPPDRADLDIFVLNGEDGNGTAYATDERLPQLPQVQ